MFKSFLVKHGLKSSPSYKLLTDLNGLRIKSAQRKLQNMLNLNPV